MPSPISAHRVSPFGAALRVGFALAGVRTLRLSVLRAATFAAAALVVLMATPAFAASKVPMCGVHAQTIAAPPITRAAKEVPLSSGSCERHEQDVLQQRAPKPAPAPLVSGDLVPRMPAIMFRLSAPPRVRMPVESFSGAARPGHSRGIERPPR